MNDIRKLIDMVQRMDEELSFITNKPQYNLTWPQIAAKVLSKFTGRDIHSKDIEIKTNWHDYAIKAEGPYGPEYFLIVGDMKPSNVKEIDEGTWEDYGQDSNFRVIKETKDELSNVLQNIPQLPQRQDALNDQLLDLAVVANKLGMYDAADFIRKIMEQ